MRLPMTIKHGFGRRYRRMCLGLLDRGPRICDVNGIRVCLDLSSTLHRQIYVQSGFEPDVTLLIRSMLRSGDVFVDIGANFGWHTVSALTHCRDLAGCYAYEPSLATYALLDRSINANDWNHRCRIARVALSNHESEGTLRTFDGMDPMHNSLYELGDASYVTETVPLDTLDNQARGFVAPPSIVKCDVEGAEHDVLEGAREVSSGMLGPPPVWLLEANYETAAMAGHSPGDLIDLAESHAPYVPYHIRNGQLKRLPSAKALRHGDMLVLAVTEVHAERLGRFPATNA
jgi:FkbM family methyltransferase